MTLAKLVNTKHDGHDDRCGERWDLARKAMDALRQSIDGLYGRFWWFVGLVLCAQGAVIMFLVSKTFH